MYFLVDFNYLLEILMQFKCLYKFFFNGQPRTIRVINSLFCLWEDFFFILLEHLPVWPAFCDFQMQKNFQMHRGPLRFSSLSENSKSLIHYSRISEEVYHIFFLNL